MNGGSLFVRYAFPPNERGTCGPDDHHTVFDYAVEGAPDGGLREIATQFLGAWPYLELLATVAGVDDPLDYRVVEAYWVGNSLLDRVPMTTFGNSLDDRFRRRMGTSWSNVASAILAGGVPHHSFHVFAVYPWAGLLAADRGPDPLHILDRCRIRWGRVVSMIGDEAVVESRPLEWDGMSLRLGAPRPETAAVAIDGRGFLPELTPGRWVSLHWRWVCDVLTAPQLNSLRARTAQQLAITNERLRSAIGA